MNIGKIGENYLNSLATKGGITCNPSIEDRKGWDFILEFDTENINLPDKNASHYMCFIQVKTTRGKKIGTQMKLSNWDYLIKRPIPTFIFYIMLNECRG